MSRCNVAIEPWQVIGFVTVLSSKIYGVWRTIRKLTLERRVSKASVTKRLLTSKAYLHGTLFIFIRSFRLQPAAIDFHL